MEFFILALIWVVCAIISCLIYYTRFRDIEPLVVVLTIFGGPGVLIPWMLMFLRDWYHGELR